MASRVVTFGVFDPLHEGHMHFLYRARVLGDTLTVVVARDLYIARTKEHTPYQFEYERLVRVASLPYVDRALLGDAEPRSYRLLEELDFDVLAIGYDQTPGDDRVRALLKRVGKRAVRVERLEAYRPDVFKSSLVREV